MEEYPGMLGPVGSWDITRLPICFTGALAILIVVVDLAKTLKGSSGGQ